MMTYQQVQQLINIINTNSNNFTLCFIVNNSGGQYYLGYNQTFVKIPAEFIPEVINTENSINIGYTFNCDSPNIVEADVFIDNIIESTTDTETENTDTIDVTSTITYGEPVSILPLITDDALSNVQTSRYHGAEWFDRMSKTSIFIAGLGGIGSNTAYSIGRCSPYKIFLLDPDIVDTVNLSGQFYDINDVGASKVSCTYKKIADYSNFNNVAYVQRRIERSIECSDIIDRFTKYNDSPPTIWISGFDNMTARKDFYSYFKKDLEKIAKYHHKEYLLIDGRLTADYLQIICIRGDNKEAFKKYEAEYLFEDSEAVETLCSFKQTSYMASMIGAMITNLVINHVNNLTHDLDINSLPFFTTYNSNIMLLEKQ